MTIEIDGVSYSVLSGDDLPKRGRNDAGLEYDQLDKLPVGSAIKLPWADKTQLNKMRNAIRSSKRRVGYEVKTYVSEGHLVIVRT